VYWAHPVVSVVAVTSPASPKIGVALGLGLEFRLGLGLGLDRIVPGLEVGLGIDK